MDNECRKTFQNVYSETQKDLISNEFTRIKGHCYLDHAGSTLYSEKQLLEVFKDFQSNYYGNPHTKSISSTLTEDVIDQVRYEILQHFNTSLEDYSVIFTSSATAALKLVGESFSYKNEESESGIFLYIDDNHTSVVGMREYADISMAISQRKAFQLLSSQDVQTDIPNCNCNSLFAFPAQSNFSGFKYPLSWIASVQTGILNSAPEINKRSKWYCLLDAASFVPSNYLDLSKYQPDFVCLSFHKMFGYPTGLGALLIKNSSATVLKKKYFGGGAVSMVLIKDHLHVARDVLHERFEDGTLPYLSIVAARYGFKTLKRLKLDMDLISQHTFLLSKYVYESLLMLHHSNGRPVSILYHNSCFEDRSIQGGIVNFNLLRFDGEYIGYAEVQHVANLYGISLRTGCSCNPGACQRHLKLPAEDVKRHFELGHVCGDQNDLIEGKPTGSVRISFGYMSTIEDAEVFLKMIKDCFVYKPLVWKLPYNWDDIKENSFYKFYTKNNNSSNADTQVMELKKNVKDNHTKVSSGSIKTDMKPEIINTNLYIKTSNNPLLKTKTSSKCTVNNEDILAEGTLQQIFIYPIKSCGSFQINNEWGLVATGLKYDRQWMIINASGVCITQKREPRLCLLKPILNLKQGTMDLEFEGNIFKSIPLELSTQIKKYASKCLSKVCGDKVEGWDCGDDIADWLSDVFNHSGLRLIKQWAQNENYTGRTSKDKSKSVISLSNQAQFLLINEESINYLLDKMSSNNFNEAHEDFIARFRPNLVVNLKMPFIENSLKIVQIGNVKFKFVGQCNRCQMICVDQSTGEKSPEPLRALSEEFNGKLKFGIYLSQDSENMDTHLKIHDPVFGYTAYNDCDVTVDCSIK